MARQLVKLGWEVDVVTPRADLWAYRRNETADFRSALRVRETGHALRVLSSGYIRGYDGIRARFVGPLLRSVANRFGLDHAWGWTISASRACRQFSPGYADIVLVSGGPFSSFTAARRFAKRIGCPLVLDYRDMWTANPHLNVGNSFQRRAEAVSLRTASGVITVAPTGMKLLERSFRLPAQRMVLTNGFDEGAMDRVTPTRFAERAIVYCGQLYSPKRVLTPVFEALSRMNDSVGGYKFHYFGTQGNIVVEQAARFGLKNMVVDHGAVSHQDSLSAIAGADLTVVVTSVDQEGSDADKAIITGKVYEPLGLGVPVLGIAPKGSDLEVVVGESGRVFPADQLSGISAYIEGVLTQTRQRAAPRMEYAWTELGARLDGFLRSVAGTATADSS